ncbi:hypothetical protein, partial [Burkholderia thailandensis]|uniref:hypothetical protein n=1 Tax=Burkholderia thailandensis TaxID=57975 RepID=UPI001C125529
RGIGTGEPPSSLPNKDAKSAEQFLKSAWLPARHAGGHSIDIDKCHVDNPLLFAPGRAMPKSFASIPSKPGESRQNAERPSP